MEQLGENDVTYISHKLDIAENHVEGLELQWTGGVKRGEASFAKYNEKEHSGRCILLQPLRRDRLKREKRYTIGETETLLTEKKKRWKGNTVKHTQRRYTLYKKEIDNGTICPVDITLKRLTKI